MRGSGCPCPCSAGTATRAPSSSTRPSGATASARASPSPAAARTARTTVPTSSRRTAPSSAAGSATIASPPRPAYAALHAVYRLLRLHVNFFQPVQKLVGRVRVEGRVRRVYDRAQTPYQRLCATGVLKPEGARRAPAALPQPQPAPAPPPARRGARAASGRSPPRRRPCRAAFSHDRPSATFAQWAQDPRSRGAAHTWVSLSNGPLARAPGGAPDGNRYF